MIMRNDTPEFENDDQNSQEPSLDFTRIRRAAKPFWDEFPPEREDRIVRGLVATEIGKAITADLSFDKQRKRVQLMIRLRVIAGFSPSQVQSVRRMQDQTCGLCFIALDEDGHIVRIMSQSVLPAAVLADAVVPQVFKDVVALLNDDNLRDIVAQSLSY